MFQQSYNYRTLTIHLREGICLLFTYLMLLRQGGGSQGEKSFLKKHTTRQIVVLQTYSLGTFNMNLCCIKALCWF